MKEIRVRTGIKSRDKNNPPLRSAKSKNGEAFL